MKTPRMLTLLFLLLLLSAQFGVLAVTPQEASSAALLASYDAASRRLESGISYDEAQELREELFTKTITHIQKYPDDELSGPFLRLLFDYMAIRQVWQLKESGSDCLPKRTTQFNPWSERGHIELTRFLGHHFPSAMKSCQEFDFGYYIDDILKGLFADTIKQTGKLRRIAENRHSPEKSTQERTVNP